METSNEWLVWQLADATFPAGGLAHSGGIEAAYKWGELVNLPRLSGLGPSSSRLEDFLSDHLTQTAHSLIPPMQAAWECLDKAIAMDQFCQAFINNHVANRASRAQGKAFLISALAAFDLPVCRKMRDDIQAQSVHGHFPVVFGAVTAALGIDLEKCIGLYLYITMRSLVSSAIRLNIVGPLEGQSLLYRKRSAIEQLAVRCRRFGPQNMAQTAPLIEIFQASQDRLYSRLFQS